MPETAIVVRPPAPFEIPHAHVSAFNVFQKLIANNEDFGEITTCEDVDDCGVFLADGSDVPCIAVAENSYGYYAVLTLHGVLETFALDALL